MKKGIKEHKELLVGIIIGLLPLIILTIGWTVFFIIVFIAMFLSIAIFFIKAGLIKEKEEEEFMKLYNKIEEELKNVTPEAYTKVELRAIKHNDVFGHVLNALISYGTIQFYARVNPATKKVRIIVIKDEKERVFEDEIACESFEKFFEI